MQPYLAQPPTHPQQDTDPGARARTVTLGLLLTSLAIAPLNTVVYFQALSERRPSASWLFTAFIGLASLQVLTGIAAAISGIVYSVKRDNAGRSRVGAIMMSLGGVMGAVGGVVGGFLGLALTALGGMGGAWGRPLRIRGRVMHPELKRGSEWSRGRSPDVTRLDADTRAALEALWLHDAQKEHASVPAFARVTWMLTAMGAPAELVDRTLVAAREEVEHTRLCFALAAGYGGRTHGVEPMPDLLLGGGLDVRGDAFTHLAVESLKDGCVLEDYNADVAAACAEACRDPVTLGVLEQIALEERSHAELSWSILAWCLSLGGRATHDRCARELEALTAIDRPTAVSTEKQGLVARADAEALLAHGRLPDSRWAAIYEARLAQTRTRLAALLAETSHDVTRAAA